MQQAATTITRLIEDYQTADAEKKRVYALAEQAADCEGDATEASCDAAYDAVEAVADVILATPARSSSHLAMKAQVLLARGTDPKDLFHYRPEDLTRFIQEVRGFARAEP